MTGLEIAGITLVVIGAAGLGFACWWQRKEIERLRIDVVFAQERADRWAATAIGLDAKTHRYERALETIANDEAALKSGTARRLRRIAREAIDG